MFSPVDSMPLLSHSLVVFNAQGYESFKKKKKKSLQWYSMHFYSWILSSNFYSLSTICGFIKHHKLELSFTGKQDDLISMGLPLLHQITFPLLVSRSTELWHQFSSQPRDIRSRMQLTFCSLSFFFQGEKREKFFQPGIFLQFYLIAEPAKCNLLSA